MILSYLTRIIRFSVKVALGTAIATSIVGITGLIFFAMFAAMLTVLGSQVKESDMTRKVVYGSENATHHFVSIPVTGMIVGDPSDVGEPFGLLSEMLTYGYEVKKSLRELADDDGVDGIILEINSPGGTIYGSKAIADGVLHYREKTNKPVIAFVAGLAGSGAYWSAVSADAVIADVGTSVGSIGVISGPFQYYDTVIAQDGGILSGGVVTQNGIETTYITAGKSKDYGNPYRRLTQTEIDSLQFMVNNEYESFVEYISERRSIPKETITEDIGALLYDGKTALDKKLIDVIGSKEEAYTLLAARANIVDSDYSVSQEYPKKGLLMSILETRGFLSAPRSVSLCGLTKVHLVYYGDIASLCQ